MNTGQSFDYFCTISIQFMYLKQLFLTNFKNYREQEFAFCDKLNSLVGNNGSGKTNVLDAIHYLSFCKGFINSIDSQNITHEQDFFAVQGIFSVKDGANEKVHCVQKLNQKKIFKLNNKEYDRLADHIGLFPMVLVSPADSNLIYKGSDERRKYFDSVISQFDAAYLNDLILYNKALFQRNTLLKSFYEKRYFDIDSIEIWNRQCIEYGTRIWEKRKDFITHFITYFQHYFKIISQGQEAVELVYVSQLNDDIFENLLNNCIAKDRNFQFSTTGIHKDDFDFIINGYPLKKFGSQGQQKSFIIALKLAQFEYTRKTKGYKPLLLFDDIFDKLDHLRVEQIIKLVGENGFGQVFITDTHPQRMQELFEKTGIPHKIFTIENGNASEIEL